MIVALSTGNKVALGIVAGIVIVFSLVASFVAPRYNPDFPGRGRGIFVFATVILVVAMLSAVVLFGSEEEEHGDEASAALIDAG